jgi:hypothetical protein
MNDFLVPIHISLAIVFLSFLFLNVYEHRTNIRRWLFTYRDEHGCWGCYRKYLAFGCYELWRLRIRCKHEVILRRFMERNRIPAIAKYTIVMP